MKTDNIFISNIFDLLEENYKNSEFGIAILSQKACMDRTTLYRKTVKFLNMTPMEILNKYRLEKALEMLNDLSLSIKEIAYSSGFSYPQHFANKFKMKYGYSPTEFRKIYCGLEDCA